MMASYMAVRKEGYLEVVLNVFVFLHQKYNSRLVFDPTYPAINISDLRECKWKDFYGEFKDVIPPTAPEERVKEFYLCRYVDSNYAG